MTRRDAPESLLAAEVPRPLEPVDPGEAQVGVQRLTHRLDEPLRAGRSEPVLPPEIENVDPGLLAVDARLDPADEAIAKENRQDVPAPAALRRRYEELPDVVEAEEAAEQAPVPDERVERGDERH